jgi:hypothetical protein
MTDKAHKILVKYADTKTTLLNAGKSLLPGAAAGVVATLATAPLDRVKDTMTQFANQASVARNEGREAEAKKLEHDSKNLGSAAKSIYSTQGAKGFYKGMSGSLIKMPIGMGITYAVAEKLKGKLKL